MTLVNRKQPPFAPNHRLAVPNPRISVSWSPSGTPAHAGKSGAVARRGRSFLALVSPYISLIRGADGGAAHCCHEHEGPTLSFPCLVPAGDRAHLIGFVGRIFVMDEVDDVELLVERVAALDLGKAVLEGAGAAPTAARQA